MFAFLDLLGKSSLTRNENIELTQSIRKSIESGGALSKLAVMDATGRITMSTKKFSESIMLGRKIKSADELNRFVEKASPEEINALSDFLGIEDWRRESIDSINRKIDAARADGKFTQLKNEFKAKKVTSSTGEVLGNGQSRTPVPTGDIGVVPQNAGIVPNNVPNIVPQSAAPGGSFAALESDIVKTLANKNAVTRMNSENMQVTGDTQAKDISVKLAYRHALDLDLLEFVDSVSNMKNKNAISKRKHSIGKISDNHAKIISDVLSSELGINIDISEYTVNIDGSAVMHIEEKHGANGTSDTSMENREDVARLGWAVNNADSGYIARTQTGNIDYSTQYKNRDGTPSPKIMIEKAIGDGKYIVAECVPDTEAKKIHIISARKIKSDNGQVLNIESSDSPQPTSETLLDGIAADNSISQIAQNSNTFSQNNSGNVFGERSAMAEDTSSTAAAVPLPQGEGSGKAAKRAPKAKKKSTYHKKRAERWKAEYNNLKSETYLRGLLSDKAYQMKDLKIGRFRNATEAQVEIFRGSIEKLSKIQFRGNLSPKMIRRTVRELREGWYTKEVPKTIIF